MSLQACTREVELREAITRGTWPLASSESLRAHVAVCRSCSTVARLAVGFRQVRAESMAAARIGSPGLLWWRAQLRRRNEAMERIGRPLVGAQIFALCVTLFAALAFVTYQVRQQGGFVEWLKDAAQSASTAMANLWPAAAADASGNWLLPMVALSVLAVAGGVVVFFSFDRS
jgi:hypothetical protein